MIASVSRHAPIIWPFRPKKSETVILDSSAPRLYAMLVTEMDSGSFAGIAIIIVLHELCNCEFVR